jgi:hypothetical protein
MAQVPPPPGVMPPLAPAPTLVQTKTFTEYYNNAALDEFHGAYGPVMAIFNSPGVPGTTPAYIRKLVLNDPQNSSMGYAVLVVPLNPPNSP